MAVQGLLKAAFLVGEQRRAQTEGLAVLQLSRVSLDRAHECGCSACMQRTAIGDECVVAQACDLFFHIGLQFLTTLQADVRHHLFGVAVRTKQAAWACHVEGRRTST